jgi:hypothetical protein
MDEPPAAGRSRVSSGDWRAGCGAGEEVGGVFRCEGGRWRSREQWRLGSVVAVEYA